ncbi:hypothetical protein ACHAWT_011251 [Skeletonema menzelii]
MPSLGFYDAIDRVGYHQLATSDLRHGTALFQLVTALFQLVTEFFSSIFNFQQVKRVEVSLSSNVAASSNSQGIVTKMKTGDCNSTEIIDVDAPVATKKKRSKKRRLDAYDDNDEKCASQNSSLLNNHPHSQLPSFLSEAFSDLYAQDGLVVLGRGLGWLSLLAAFVRYYGDPECNGVETGDDDDSAAVHTNTSTSLPPPKYAGDEMLTECKLQQSPIQKQPKRPPLIFVLNLRDKERQVLFSTLTSWGCPPDQLPTLITNEAGQNEERAVKYARGGVFVITSRILIVDLLNGTANAKAIDGMLVAHAENVDETSTEAFILRIFRSQKYFMENTSTYAGCSSQNNSGFIKAFTDNATTLVSGFAKTEKILKALQVPNIYLYPRFHAAVAEELEANPPLVEELHQALTPKMKECQDHLKMAVRAVMRELKAKSPMVDFSVFLGGGDARKKRKKNDYTSVGQIGKTDDSKNDFAITLEQCITTNFDRVISRQLEGDWHRLSFKVKQLVKDLGKLRQLFHNLIHYDSIDFLNFLQGIKAMNLVSMEPSLWIGEYSGENVFRIAKERVYRVSQKGKLVTVLEENMKESLLQQVLTEIENRREKKTRESEEANDGSAKATMSNNILLMVKDERALKSVRDYLVEGGKRSMGTKWLRFLERANEKTRSLLNSMEGGLKSLSGDQRLLYEEEAVVRNTLFPRDGNTTVRDQLKEVDFAVRHKNLAASQKKRRKIAEEKSRGRANADMYEDQALFEEKIEASRLSDSRPQLYSNDSDDSSTMSCSSDDEDERLFKVDPIEGMSLFIRAFSQIEEGEAALLLQDLHPDTVIMYDSDASFIRTLEMYANTMASTSEDEKKRLQVFFLLYESCAEEIGFTKMLERETDAFNRLIDYKKRMPSLVSTFNTFSTQEMQQSHGGVGGSYAGGTLPLSMDTRTGRGKQNGSKERRDIAVDVREFRAKLPSVLHQGGMRIAPATLVVGDYILSDVHCVERKSISDFYQSMDNSSRLKEQAEKMAKYYKIPILLLEFDPDKTFQLQNASELGGEIRKNSITSKLCILVTAFPMLRILWSRSPHETLKMFKKLKRNHQEVDVDKAIEIGTNDAMDELLGGGAGGCYNEDDDEGDGANEAAVQMLLRLPGVTSHNARNIMRECDSIAELAEMSREKLKLLAGQKAGQKLFTFFRQSFSG